MDPVHVPESNGTPDSVALNSGALSAEDAEGRNPGTTESLHYHPSYPFRSDSLVGDLVLLSKDGVHFHVHSTILKFASSFFREMLEIPRTHLESARDPIPLEENANIVAVLLDIIYPNFHLREANIKRAAKLYVEDLITAADKYDMAEVIATVKSVLFDNIGREPSSGDSWSAIRRYDLACRLQWEGEARLAASWTLHRSLTTNESLYELKRVSSRSILQLQELHRNRLQTMIDSLESVFEVSWARGSSPLPTLCFCGRLPIRTNDAWQHFIYTMTNLLKNDPLATSLDGKWESQGYAQIFKIKHDTSCSRDTTILDKSRFIAGVRNRLDQLPTSIY